jgi:hypothetical protein
MFFFVILVCTKKSRVHAKNQGYGSVYCVCFDLDPTHDFKFNYES